MTNSPLNKSATNYLGSIEYYDNSIIKGWALNKLSPDTPLPVRVMEGKNIISEISPAIFRWDLKKSGFGRGYHGFIYRIPSDLLDGNEREIRLYFEDTGIELNGGPVIINLLPESQYTPVKMTDLTGSNALVVAPHSDDETFGCGGAVIHHTNAGDNVKVVYLTDGSKGDFTGRYRKEEYISIREKEASTACGILGVTDIEFWKYPDRNLKATQEDIDRLSELIASFKPGIIYVPSPFEFHPDHRVAAEIVWLAVQKKVAQCKIAFCEINTAIRINTLVDITSVIETKERAGNSYQSQLQNISYTDFALALDRFRALSVCGASQYAEGYFIIDSSEALKHPIERFSSEQFFSVFNQSKQDSPPVSVIIRTKDRGNMLRDALSSLVTQDYPNIEAVIVNDGGEDVSGVIKKFENYLDIQYISFEKPKGRTTAGNEGIKAAKGKYINFLDDDDVFYHNHVSKLVKYMIKTGAKAVYSDCEIGRYEWTGEELRLKGEKSFFRGVEHDLDQLHVFNYIPNMTMMFEKDILEKAGYPDEDLEIYEDWDLFLKIGLQTDLVRLPGVTAEYRILSERNYDHNKWRMKIYEKYSDYFKTDDLETWFISKTDQIYEENRYLRRRLDDQTSTSANRQFKQSIKDSYIVWKLTSLFKKYTPQKMQSVIRVILSRMR